MRRLRRDIAFLSQTRRAIIYSYNYQGKSIAQITREMACLKAPKPSESVMKKAAEYGLEAAEIEARDYPPQMRDFVMSWNVGGFIDNTVAMMVMDILYARHIPPAYRKRKGNFKSPYVLRHPA